MRFSLFSSAIIFRLLARRVQQIRRIPPPYLHTNSLAMAPKRKAPVAAIDSDEEAELAAKPAKKAAVKKALLVPTNPDAFTNKEFPAALDFARPAEGAVRIAAWNTVRHP